MIKRQISNSLREKIEQFPILTLTGPRQSGKTTLLINEFPSFQYFSLEDPGYVVCHVSKQQPAYDHLFQSWTEIEKISATIMDA